MKLLKIKQQLRDGPYAWPGGYPKYFLTGDGEALSFKTVRTNWREVCQAHIYDDRYSDWYIVACAINYEDPDLYDAETQERIESAYAEPESTRMLKGE